MKRFISMVTMVLSLVVAPAWLNAGALNPATDITSPTTIDGFFALQGRLASANISQNRQSQIIDTLYSSLIHNDFALLKTRVSPAVYLQDEHTRNIYGLTDPGTASTATMSLASILVIQGCNEKAFTKINSKILRRQLPGEAIPQIINVLKTRNDFDDSNGTRPYEHALYCAGYASIGQIGAAIMGDFTANISKSCLMFRDLHKHGLTARPQFAGLWTHSNRQWIAAFSALCIAVTGGLVMGFAACARGCRQPRVVISQVGTFIYNLAVVQAPALFRSMHGCGSRRARSTLGYIMGMSGEAKAITSAALAKGAWDCYTSKPSALGIIISAIMADPMGSALIAYGGYKFYKLLHPVPAAPAPR